MLSPQICLTRISRFGLRTEMRWALVVAMAALIVSACGAIGTGAAPPAGASPSSGPGLSFDVAVSEKDKAVNLHVGQKLEAVLHGQRGMTPWSAVRSTDQSVLAPIVNPGAISARGITLAAFQALAPGKAQITATAGADCSQAQVCPQYQMVLTIEVTVAA
jgi:hypothetical protein